MSVCVCVCLSVCLSLAPVGFTPFLGLPDVNNVVLLLLLFFDISTYSFNTQEGVRSKHIKGSKEGYLLGQSCDQGDLVDLVASLGPFGPV